MSSFDRILRVPPLVGVGLAVGGCVEDSSAPTPEETAVTDECRVVAEPLSEKGAWVLDWSAVDTSLITGAPLDSYSDFRGLLYSWVTPTEPVSDGWYCAGAYEIGLTTSVDLTRSSGVEAFTIEDEAPKGTHLAAILFAEEPLSVALGALQAGSTATTLYFPNGGE